MLTSPGFFFKEANSFLSHRYPFMCVNAIGRGRSCDHVFNSTNASASQIAASIYTLADLLLLEEGTFSIRFDPLPFSTVLPRIPLDIWKTRWRQTVKVEKRKTLLIFVKDLIYV